MNNMNEKKDLIKLQNAIEFVNKYYPLPRCIHGNALKDHGGERLYPSCGCNANNVGTGKSDEK